MVNRAAVSSFGNFVCRSVAAGEWLRCFFIRYDVFPYTRRSNYAILKNEVAEFFVIYDDGFNYLTKMCLTNMRDAAFKMIHIAKEKGCTVIVSSSDATDRHEMYLEEGADFILMGEAELTLAGTYQLSLKKTSMIFSISRDSHSCNNNSVVKTAKRNVMKELDDLPFPAWDIIDIETLSANRG